MSRKPFPYAFALAGLVAFSVLTACTYTGRPGDALQADAAQFTGGGSSEAPTSAAPAPAPLSSDGSMLGRHNAERAAHGVGPLAASGPLTSLAARRCPELASNFSHAGWPQAMAEMGIYYAYRAENIAWGYANASAAMSGWMGSSGHRANILNGVYTEAGFADCVVGGTHYWVAEFGG